jgi:hypothetical protein
MATFRAPRVIEFPDDSAAIKYAEHCLDGAILEVWDHARQVARLDPRSRGSWTALGDRHG